MLFFYYMSSSLIDSRTSIIRLWDGRSPIGCASLSCRSTSTGSVAAGRWSSPTWCDWSLITTVSIIIHGISESDIILLLNICTIILIDDLYLYVNTPSCYLLICCVVSWWFILLYKHVLGEVEVLIVGLDHILASWVFEPLSLSLGKGLFAYEVGRGWILFDASLC